MKNLKYLVFIFYIFLSINSFALEDIDDIQITVVDDCTQITPTDYPTLSRIFYAPWIQSFNSSDVDTQIDLLSDQITGLEGTLRQSTKEEITNIKNELTKLRNALKSKTNIQAVTPLNKEFYGLFGFE